MLIKKDRVFNSLGWSGTNKYYKMYEIHGHGKKEILPNKTWKPVTTDYSVLVIC